MPPQSLPAFQNTYKLQTYMNCFGPGVALGAFRTQYGSPEVDSTHDRLIMAMAGIFGTNKVNLRFASS